MDDAFPRLTLFLGPPSGHGLAVNLAVRDNRPAMIKSGLQAHPTRLASPALRSLADPNRTLDERREVFEGFTKDGPAFFAALNFFGAPNDGFRKAEIYPDAVVQLGALAEVAGDTPLRVILTPDNLADLVLAAGSEALESRVRATPWEQLFEAGWAALIGDVTECLTGAEVLVLTHAGTALGGADLIRRLFGPAADQVAPRLLLREALEVTGQAVLERMGPGAPTDEAARDLYRSFAVRADVATCRDRLGMDRLLRKLILQRFDEDIGRIAAMDRVEVV